MLQFFSAVFVRKFLLVLRKEAFFLTYLYISNPIKMTILPCFAKKDYDTHVCKSPKTCEVRSKGLMLQFSGEKIAFL